MTKYYLIRGNQIISTVEVEGNNFIVISRLGGGDAMSLLNEDHATNLMSNLGLTAVEALDALGIADLRDSMLTTVFMGSEPVGLAHGLSAELSP